MQLQRSRRSGALFRSIFHPFAVHAEKMLEGPSSNDNETDKYFRQIANGSVRQLIETVLTAKLDNATRNRLVNNYIARVEIELTKLDKLKPKYGLIRADESKSKEDEYQYKRVYFRYLLKIQPEIKELAKTNHPTIISLGSTISESINALMTEGFRVERLLERFANIISECPTTGKIILRPFCGRP